MNEEEKQAYNYLEKYIKWETLGERNLEGDIKTILDLIKKQQKEIERLKNFNKNTYIRKDTIEHIRDKAEYMDYYSLSDVIADLTKLIGDKKYE